MSEYDDLIPPEKPPDEAAEEGNPPVPAAQANVDSPASTDDQPTPTDEDALAAGLKSGADVERESMDKGVVPWPPDGTVDVPPVPGPDETLKPWVENPDATLVGLGGTSWKVAKKRMEKGVPAYATTLTREQYVEREVAITKAQMDKGLIKTNPIVDGKDRLDRSRAYAEWRWDAFHRGEVGSL